jgi:hypothetical protein
LFLDRRGRVDEFILNNKSYTVGDGMLLKERLDDFTRNHHSGDPYKADGEIGGLDAFCGTGGVVAPVSGETDLEESAEVGGEIR